MLSLVLVAALAGPALAAGDAAPPPATDRATQEARAHFRRATSLYHQARYHEAISEFEAAYRLKPHGVIYFNLAQCHERLGDVPAALSAYREYLREVPHAEDRDTVQAAMANLEARLGAMGVQQLIVLTDPTGAEVQVDGQARGRTPFSATLPLGTHQVLVGLANYETLRREVVLTPDRAIQLDFALSRVEPKPEETREAAPPPSAPAAPAASALPPALAPAPAAAQAPLVPTEPEARKPTEHHRVFTWVAAGAAVVAAGAGVYYGVEARNASNDLRAMATPNGARAQDLANSATSRARTANILYGVAGAACAAGVTLYFLEGRF